MVAPFGQRTTLRVNADGYLASLLIQAGELTLNRDSQNGFITETSLGNVTTSQSYNSFGELSSYQARLDTTELLAIQYSRDQLERIREKVETLESQMDTYSYEYDLAGRLVEVKKNSNLVATYTYDNNRNRLSYTNLSGTHPLYL